MQVILLQEGICGPGDTWSSRLKSCIREATIADQVGFDGYALSEQHFASGEAIVSSPEIVLPAIASLTRNIRLRIASVNLLPYNHPLRVVEQIAILDLVSGGRAELGGARSNNPYTLDGFGVSAAQTRDYRNEHLNILGQAFSNGFVEYESEHYKIPKRTIAPWPKGRRPPPVHLSASSPESHRDAALYGVGVMTGFGLLGWEYASSCLSAYKSSIGEAKPIMGSVINRAAFFSAGISCHSERQVARDMTRANTLRFVEVIVDYYSKLAERAADYKYMSNIERIAAHKTDLDYLIAATPWCMSGTPDDIIASARKVYEMGYDDLIWRIDGMGHRNNVATIEMIGRHVLPELHSWPEHCEATSSSTWMKDPEDS